MDGPTDLDIDGLRSSVASVEHLLVRFTPLAERLLLDFRTRADAGPGVALLPQVSSFTERVQTIEDARPGFPKPERIHVVTWPLPIASLERLGILESIRGRLAEMDAFEVIARVDETYARLLELERVEIRRAIEGDGYHTIWPVEQSQRRSG
ncbi:MAG: hypothetical protein O2895_00840 [Chloroflexi bacterium]|nr:hypothetical protein [Chloroflexota bacterium]